MRKLFKYISVIALLVFSGCELTNLDHLDNPNGVSPENAEARFVFYAVQLNFTGFYNTVTFNTTRPVRMLAMSAGNIYNNAFDQGTFNGAWNIAYSELLPDMDALIAVAEAEGNEFPDLAGATKTMKAYVLMTLVDLFGNVPYSQAGQGVVEKSPAADSAQDVYNAALALLDDAIKDFGTDGPQIDSGDDLYYGGDADKWLALAQTLKLKWHLTTRLAGGSGSEINSLIGNIIDESSEDFVAQFGTERNNPNSRHPWYNNQYELGGGTYMSNYYMWSLSAEKGIADPRLRYYFYRQDAQPELADPFTLDCNTQPRPLHYTGPYPFCVVYDGGYWGRDHGDNAGIPPDGERRTAFGVYPAGGKFDSDNSVNAGAIVSIDNGGTDGGLGGGIAPIMLSSFSHFMLAEAALTMGVTGDPRAYLETGMRQSIEKVMSFGALDGSADASLFPTADDVNAYVDLVLANYDAAADDDARLDIIMKEYHIALWGNGIEAYNGYRRTGKPSGMQPSREPNPGDFPRLMPYPADYVNLNANASQRVITEQVFWDTNPAGIYDF